MSVISSGGKLIRVHIKHSPISKLESNEVALKSECVKLREISIMLISCGIAISVLLMMFIGLSLISTTLNQISSCREKIIGYEQKGYYSSLDQFWSAESYCYRL